MIVENRWFNLQFPRRADLSGRPFGVLLIWLGGVGVMSKRDRFQPHPVAREFGFHVPPIMLMLRSLLFPKYEFLDCQQLLDQADYIPHDWEQWPEAYRKCSEAAVTKAIEERPGCKLVSDKSACDRRVDLSGRPLQLYRSIILKKAA